MRTLRLRPDEGSHSNPHNFSQSQGWLILAEALCGHGERAFTYFIENAPAAWNNQAELRCLEPYCYGQFTEGRYLGIRLYRLEDHLNMISILKAIGRDIITVKFCSI